jgi:hypothetical protein
MQASTTQKSCTNAAKSKAPLPSKSASEPFRYAELLQGGKIQNLRRSILCCTANLMQQFTGANMINY